MAENGRENFAMKLHKHIGFGRNAQGLVAEIESLGLRTKSYDGIEQDTLWPRYLEIAEDHPRWDWILRILADHKGRRGVWEREWTEYTDAERADAECLALNRCWTAGYPEPTDQIGDRLLFEESTYSVFDRCKSCRLVPPNGGQIASFRMKAAPRWGRRAIMQLNWVSDELFVNPSVWSGILERFKLSTRPVLLHKNGAVIENVGQVRIEQVTELSIRDSTHSVCVDCGKGHFSCPTRGFSPAPVSKVPSIAWTNERFGEVRAHRILISGELYRAITAVGIRGAEFAPCEAIASN